MPRTACIALAHVSYVYIEAGKIVVDNGHQLDVAPEIAQAIADAMHKNHTAHTCTFDRREAAQVSVEGTITTERP